MSRNELDQKIFTFLQRKEDEFPELKLNPDVLIQKIVR